MQMINIKSYFRCITVDPVNLSISRKLLSALSSFIAILVVACVTDKFDDSSAYPFIVASMGASTVILFIMPGSPLAQPWPLVGGHLISAVIGITCAQIFSNIIFASACATGGSILTMLLLRCLHPPAAATALTRHSRRLY
jgi:CBS domain-containing membrane protein